MNSPHFRISNPPSKPILIWDGDCRFCELWIERWRVLNAGKTDAIPYQQAASRYPEILQEQFERAIVYIDTEGKVFTGAAAIFPPC